MEQIDYDNKLCKLFVAYEEKSEIVGMMEFVSDLKNEAAPAHVASDRTVTLLRILQSAR